MQEKGLGTFAVFMTAHLDHPWCDLVFAIWLRRCPRGFAVDHGHHRVGSFGDHPYSACCR